MSTAAQARIPEVTLPWRLRIALEDAGITREEMAERLDVSVATISRWVHGKGAAPRRPYLKEWAELTGVSLEWLERGQGATPPSGRPTAEELAEKHAAKVRRRRDGGKDLPARYVYPDSAVA